MARGLQIITAASSNDPEPDQSADDLILVQPVDSSNHAYEQDNLDIANGANASTPLYDSLLSTICVRPPVPSIEVTRQAGEALFMDFCQSHIAFEGESEIIPDALPEDVAPSVTRLLQ